jgi:FkbM family methyltransferase
MQVANSHACRIAEHAKRAVKQAVITQYRKALRSLLVLKSDYPELLFDAPLEMAFSMQVMPVLTMLGEDDCWKRFEIGGFEFYWPQAYAIENLPGVYQEVFGAVERNPHAYEYKDVRLRPGGWVLDGGACEGFFVHYALLCGCKVLAVEPVPLVAQTLERTFKAEILAGKVRVINAALGKENGTCAITIPNSEALMARIAPTGEVSVTMITVDELLKSEGISKLDFLKLDIEGEEVAAMFGAEQTLKFHRPVISIAVYHEAPNAARLKQFIRAVEPSYALRYRGVCFRLGKPRPFLLLGIAP